MEKISPKYLLWEYHQKLTERFNALNEIQSKYRLLASTWILFGMSAIGYTIEEAGLFNRDELVLTGFFQPAILIPIGIICMIICFGILVIFIQDILFYQNLVAAIFIEQKALEKSNSWLPQISNNVRTIMKGLGRKMQITFYQFGISLNLIISLMSFCLAWWQLSSLHHKDLLLFILLLFSVMILFFVNYLFNIIPSPIQLEQRIVFNEKENKEEKLSTNREKSYLNFETKYKW